MAQQDLQAALAAVRAELEHLESRDPEACRRIESLIGAIEEQATGEAPRAVHPAVGTGLADSIRHLEADHPNLTAGLAQLISTLSSMGI